MSLVLKTPGEILTFTATRFYPLEPRERDIHILDIAVGLAAAARFRGQTSQYFSVAQHSIDVSLACPKEFALWGLLHDAAEAYLSDIPGPLKMLPEFAWYRSIEDRLMAVIAERFQLATPMPAIIKQHDDARTAAEKAALLNRVSPLFDFSQIVGRNPNKHQVIALPPQLATVIFLQRFLHIANTCVAGPGLLQELDEANAFIIRLEQAKAEFEAE